ncbi:MAG: EamA family transporter [Actinobacteria bacterium]|nr:EamA family transporter [Actinomycetota bacterium]
MGHQTPEERRSTAVGVGMYLLAAFLFAFNGVIAKAALNTGFDPVHLTQLRNAGAMVVLVAYIAIRHRDRFRVSRRELPFLIAYGVIAFTLVQYLYFLTISKLNVGIGTLLAFLAPVIVALWMRFAKKREVSNRIWLAIGLTLAGLALVAQVWQGATLDPIGVAAGLMCAVALAVYWLLGESGQQHRDAVSLTMWGFIFASITWAIIAPWWSFPWSDLFIPTEPLLPSAPGLPVWALMVWGVLLGTIAPFLLVLGSLRRVGAQRAGIVGTTEPLWAALIGLALLGETFSGVQAVGGLIVLAGVVVAETSRTSGVAVTPGEFPQIREE